MARWAQRRGPHGVRQRPLAWRQRVDHTRRDGVHLHRAGCSAVEYVSRRQADRLPQLRVPHRGNGGRSPPPAPTRKPACGSWSGARYSVCRGVTAAPSAREMSAAPASVPSRTRCCASHFSRALPSQSARGWRCPPLAAAGRAARSARALPWGERRVDLARLGCAVFQRAAGLLDHWNAGSPRQLASLPSGARSLWRLQRGRSWRSAIVRGWLHEVCLAAREGRRMPAVVCGAPNRGRRCPFEELTRLPR